MRFKNDKKILERKIRAQAQRFGWPNEAVELKLKTLSRLSEEKSIEALDLLSVDIVLAAEEDEEYEALSMQEPEPTAEQRATQNSEEELAEEQLMQTAESADFVEPTANSSDSTEELQETPVEVVAKTSKASKRK